MKFNIALPFAATLLATLIGCGAAPEGGAEGATTASEKTAMDSAHARAPSPASAWAEDEPVPPGTPELSDEPGETDEPEDTTPELDTAASSEGDVGQSSAALSTTSGTSFKFTYYWIAQRPKSDPNQVTLRDCDGRFLSYASYAWRDQVRMEMTGRFTKSDGTKVTFNDWGGCWKKLGSDYNWGAGVWNTNTNSAYKLRPFRSIAVDPAVLKVGKWYYVKELDGVQMPYPVSTLKHNGCVRAVDTGWSFSGRHIDFYAGLKSAYTNLSGGALAGKYSVTVYDGSVKCAVHISRGY